jgi:hypothetical protein
MSEDAHEAGLDPDEPHTPAWLTFLGIGLLLFAGIFLLATGGDETEVVVAEGEEAPAAVDAAAGEAAPEGAAKPTNPADPHAGHGH